MALLKISNSRFTNWKIFKEFCPCMTFISPWFRSSTKRASIEPTHWQIEKIACRNANVALYPSLFSSFALAGTVRNSEEFARNGVTARRSVHVYMVTNTWTSIERPRLFPAWTTCTRFTQRLYASTHFRSCQLTLSRARITLDRYSRAKYTSR